MKTINKILKVVFFILKMPFIITGLVSVGLYFLVNNIYKIFTKDANLREAIAQLQTLGINVTIEEIKDNKDKAIHFGVIIPLKSLKGNGIKDGERGIEVHAATNGSTPQRITKKSSNSLEKSKR